MNQMIPTLNLFALTSVPGMRVLRMPLAVDVHAGVSELFRSQELEFMQGIEEEIKFDGMYRPEESELLYVNNFDDAKSGKLTLASGSFGVVLIVTCIGALAVSWSMSR